MDIDIEVNREYFNEVKFRNQMYADKLYTLMLESGEDSKELKNKYFNQLNLNALDKIVPFKDDVIVSYGLKTNTVYSDKKLMVLKYLEYYKSLYYNKNERSEEVVWLTALQTKTFTELYEVLSHILKPKDLIEFMDEVEKFSMDEFNLHEWEKEKLDKIVEETKIENAKAEGKNEGISQSKIEIAKRMLEEKIDILVISKVTGLSEEEIQRSQEKSD